MRKEGPREGGRREGRRGEGERREMAVGFAAASVGWVVCAVGTGLLSEREGRGEWGGSCSSSLPCLTRAPYDRGRVRAGYVPC